MKEGRERDLGNTYDVELLRRLWHYVQPYRGQFALALLCLPLTSACMLAQPYLLKVAVDWHMQNGDPVGLAQTALLFALALSGQFLIIYDKLQKTKDKPQKKIEVSYIVLTNFSE